MRRQLLTVFLVALLALSGCSAVGPAAEPTGETTFEETVSFPMSGVVGESTLIAVVANNTGENRGTYEATLRVDGEAVTSDSVTVAAGQERVVELTYTFDEAGQRRLSVGNESTTVQVYER